MVVENTVSEQDGECGRIESVRIRNGIPYEPMEFTLCMKENILTRIPGTSGGFPTLNSDKLPMEVLADFNQPFDTYWPAEIEGDYGQISQPAWKVHSNGHDPHVNEVIVNTYFCYGHGYTCDRAYFALNHTYRQDIGFVGYREWHAYGKTELRGAVIDGVVVGDTTFYTGTSIDQEWTDSPREAAISSAYPNPFNPRTVVSFHLSGDRGGSPVQSPVRLSVFDLLGREVAVLADAVMAPGSHSATFDAMDLPSGVYVVVLRAGAATDRRLVTLVK
jgi:hypothetical protein